jgi:hypothetical protein
MIPPGVVFNGEFWEGNTSASTGPENTLTVAKLQAAMREAEHIMANAPPPPHFDLYGHMLDDVTGYELAAEIRPPHLRGTPARRTLVVPRNQIDRWAYELRRMGADVRVEPRIPEPVPKMDSADPTSAPK